MQRCLIFILLGLFAFSCSPADEEKEKTYSSEIARPKQFINIEQMKALLTDIHKVEAIESLSNVLKPDSIKPSEHKALFLEALKKHEVSESVFLENMAYYQMERTQELYEIYEELEVDFSEELGILK